jgi:Rod binding domain-containing protein
MKINPVTASPASAATLVLGESANAPAAGKKPPTGRDAREVFDAFVGQTFYGQMLKAMRSTLDKPAYFHGGRAEEVFQGQLDQMLAEQMAKNDASSFTGAMYQQFEALNNLGNK